MYHALLCPFDLDEYGIRAANIVELTANRWHTCARGVTGLWCWGSNYYTQLGIGGTYDWYTGAPQSSDTRRLLPAPTWVDAGEL